MPGRGVRLRSARPAGGLPLEMPTSPHYLAHHAQYLLPQAGAIQYSPLLRGPYVKSVVAISCAPEVKDHQRQGFGRRQMESSPGVLAPAVGMHQERLRGLASHDRPIKGLDTRWRSIRSAPTNAPDPAFGSPKTRRRSPRPASGAHRSLRPHR